MAEALGDKSANLVRLVQERALSKKGKEEERQPQNVLEQMKQQDTVVPYLPKDCVSNILVRLPIESLIPKSMLVCKPWYNIITSPTFIHSHFNRSESVLVFQRAVLDEGQPNPPAPLLLFRELTFNKTSKFSIQFIEFKEGNSRLAKYNVSCSGKIRASCNGLLLMDSAMKRGGLMVVNPITRKWIFLPVGSLVPRHAESYGFANSDVTGDYKVVHLFRDELGYINCEILNVGAQYWKEVNGPAFGLFGWLGYAPVPAIGALHWIPQIDHSDYLVSLELANEKFHTVPLPKRCRTHDRILEMGRFLSFVAHEELGIDIWILKGLQDEVWIKHHRIRTIGCVLDMVPILSLTTGGDMIFTRKEDGSLHAYDFKLGLMRKLQRHIPSTSFPRINGLIRWEKAPDVCD